MTEPLKIGDRVEIHLDAKFGEREGWYNGVIVRIDPYSDHRSFYWVQLSDDAQAVLNLREISIFNPRHIRKSA